MDGVFRLSVMSKYSSFMGDDPAEGGEWDMFPHIEF